MMMVGFLTRGVVIGTIVEVQLGEVTRGKRELEAEELARSEKGRLHKGAY